MDQANAPKLGKIKVLIRPLVYGILAYSIVCSLLYLIQRRLIYFPASARSQRYPVLQLDTARQVDSNTLGKTNSQGESRLPNQQDSRQLAASYHDAKSDRLVIYFGGNAEDVTSSMDSLVESFQGCSVYAMHYRGYGKSTGYPSEPALHADAILLWEHLRPRYNEIIVVGRSLGSGVAARLAAERRVEKLILITPFDSLIEVARTKFPFVPVKLLLSDRFDSVQAAQQIDVPVLILAAKQDTIIPLPHTQRLADSFKPGQCEMKVIPRTDHNSLRLTPKLVAEFLATSHP